MQTSWKSASGLRELLTQTRAVDGKRLFDSGTGLAQFLLERAFVKNRSQKSLESQITQAWRGKRPAPEWLRIAIINAVSLRCKSHYDREDILSALRHFLDSNIAYEQERDQRYALLKALRNANKIWWLVFEPPTYSEGDIKTLDPLYEFLIEWLIRYLNCRPTTRRKREKLMPKIRIIAPANQDLDRFFVRLMAQARRRAMAPVQDEDDKDKVFDRMMEALAEKRIDAYFKLMVDKGKYSLSNVVIIEAGGRCFAYSYYGNWFRQNTPCFELPSVEAGEWYSRIRAWEARVEKEERMANMSRALSAETSRLSDNLSGRNRGWEGGALYDTDEDFVRY